MRIKKSEMKNRYAPQRWQLGHVLLKITGLLGKIRGAERGSKEWYLLQFKREIAQMKKHIIFFEETVERYEKSIK